MNTSMCRCALLAVIAIVLSGCASLFPESCEQFEERRKTTNYATEYSFESSKLNDDARALGKNELAVVPRYQMTLTSDSIPPCSHVKIKKELVLVRRDNVDVVFEEKREFFAEDGTRIAVKSEVLTKQLDKSGRYAAVVPLPIPTNAPPGKYRLTSTLTLKTKNNAKALVLGHSTAVFQVTAAKK